MGEQTQKAMDLSRRPLDDVIASGEAVARAASVHAAVDVLLDSARRVFGADACLFEHTDRGWVLLGATGEDAARRLQDSPPTLERVPLAMPPRLLSLGPAGDVWTAASLQAPDGPPLAVVVAGDWTGTQSLLHTWTAVTALALAAVRERTLRQRTDGELIGGYAAARRLTRLGGIERVCQRVVEDTAQLLGVERVSLAAYRAADDCLAIEAATGYPLVTVENVRIEPGAWVIGHVFSSGRPLLVRDVRQVRGMASERQRYRTSSFAAVPLFAGSQTIGVLTATDKKDGSAFDRKDVLTLRMIAVMAVLAIVAARSHDEAGRLSYAATVDSLTGLHNRPYLDERLHQEVERARRGGYTLAVLMADIDDFKIVNDTFGHPRGDAVLQAIGGILRTAVRVFDVCARYGGDEFAILMPSSDARNAAACGERIRRRVAEYKSEHHTPPLPSLTMSIGVAVTVPGDSAADVIMRADRSLYEAKASGKNRVCVHPVGADGRPVAPAAERQKESM